MKHLLFALLFITFSASAQTANYTQSVGKNGIGTDNRTIFYDIGIDTVTGSNDTLLIQFDRNFPAFYGATYSGVLATSSTSTTAKAEILGRNKSTETWVIVEDVAFASEGVTYSVTADVDYLQLAVRIISTTGNAHVNSSLVLKKKSSSAAAGGGASYLVYTALLTQTGTNAPVATVLENTIGTITWSYSAAGLYIGTCSGCFTANKTVALCQTYLQTNADFPDAMRVRREDANTIYVWSFANNALDTFVDGILMNEPVEIRVYP